jgi:acetylglutamate kinase
MVLLLIEPLSYVLISLCEKAGIKDFIVYGGEDEDDTEEDQREIQSLKESNLEKLAKEKIGNVTTVPQGALPTEIVADIAQANLPSLLEPSVEEPKSLLAT